ncbi:MAG: CoA activase, partial [Myxococcales bacterium]|nr:CoA activase [Myxococcales bacterium]
EVKVELLGRRTKRAVRRPFRRSSAASWKRRGELRVGMPKALNMWSTGPFWRTYLETVGVKMKNVVFSDDTSEEMWIEGGKYGSIDPCYPSKVAQAHIHDLLFHKHSPEKPLDFIFFPCLTHMTTKLVGVMDTTSCPIVAGTPEVMKSAFTKEIDFFADRGVTYVDFAVTFTEPNLLKRQMFEGWAQHLGMTEDESDFAVDQAWKALERFDTIMEDKGREVLEAVERDDAIALLMIGRPYHSDPGLNHSVMDEFQVLGYPVLSMRSIPKDPAWLERFYADGLASGTIAHVLDLNDIWPENYSANSAQKVWSARFAARHPNVAVLDLSSFKCGHDAPTYGLVDSIINASGTPYSALHDIDANKPTGSIKIRVKTYAHSLKLHRERLEDVSRQKAELGFRVEAKRVALLEMKAAQLAQRGAMEPGLAAQIAQARERMAAYEARRPPPEKPKLPEGAIGLDKLSLGKRATASAAAHASAAGGDAARHAAAPQNT